MALRHEMGFDRQKLRENCDSGASAATFTRETRFGRQKLPKKSRF